MAGLLTVGLLLMAGAAGCASQTNDDAINGSAVGDITVFAAASLAPVMEELAELFETQAGIAERAAVQISLAGSSALREQLLAGAPGDVFIPAAASHLAVVARERPLSGGEVVVARNSLALAVPANNPAEVTGLADLERGGLLVGLCNAAVPCGALAREALAQADIAASVDTETPNVSALATLLAVGELDVGIVYKTNTLAPEIVGIAWTAGASPPQTSYAAGVLGDSKNKATAHAFVDFLRSPPAQAIFARHGFELP